MTKFDISGICPFCKDFYVSLFKHMKECIRIPIFMNKEKFEEFAERFKEFKQ